MKNVPNHDFINYNENKISHYGDSTNIMNVYRKIDSLILFGNKNISILHIGGSHIQADILPHQIRRNLAKLDHGMAASRGVLFPYRIASTNAPWNYRISYTGEWQSCKNSSRPFSFPMGITGYAAQSSDDMASLKIKLNRDSSVHWSFNKIKMIAYTSLHPITPIAYYLNDTIKASFDSLSNSYTFYLNEYTDSLTIDLIGVNDSNTITLSALIPENKLNGFTYHSVGVNGASVPSWLRCHNFSSELKLIDPDIIVLNIGINDANMSKEKFSPERFKNNYNKLIANIKEVKPNAAIIFITNNDCYYRVSRYHKALNQNSVRVREAFIDLAKQHNASVWDMFTIMGGLSSINKWVNAGIANPDRIHFNIDGYKILGDLFYNALIHDYLYKK